MLLVNIAIWNINVAIWYYDKNISVGKCICQSLYVPILIIIQSLSYNNLKFGVYYSKVLFIK